MRHIIRRLISYVTISQAPLVTLVTQLQNTSLGSQVHHVPIWDSFRGSLLSLGPGSDPPQHDPGAKETEARLFRKDDLSAWIVFFGAFIVLIIFDNFVMHRSHDRIPFCRAVVFMMFWIACAGIFCLYIWYTRGGGDAFDWATGYLLEWMLSVDNLFVFRSIFLVFKTPDNQKHKPLFWGIVGAIVFRMVFFVVEELLLHHFSWMHVLLGAFLVYTGFKVVMIDEEEDDPSKNTVYTKIIQYLPYVDAYSPHVRFFEHVPVHPVTGKLITNGIFTPTESEEEGSPLPPECMPTETRLVATRLTLVTICLEVTDVIFAVDSVSAIVAQIPDLYLAYTACVFAMLGLRATFFVVDELVGLFTLLPYAVAAILVFIGVKLMLRSWFHIPPQIVCIILVSALALSIIGSIIWDRSQGKSGCEGCCQAVENESCCARDKHQSDQKTAAFAAQEERIEGLK